MVILKVGYLRAREDFGCCFLCGGNELSRHGLGCGGGGVRSARFHLAAVHAHADIVLTVDLDRSNVDDELRGHWEMSFAGVGLGVFYQKTAIGGIWGLAGRAENWDAGEAETARTAWRAAWRPFLHPGKRSARSPVALSLPWCWIRSSSRAAEPSSSAAGRSPDTSAWWTAWRESLGNLPSRLSWRNASSSSPPLMPRSAAIAAVECGPCQASINVFSSVSMG